jgi:uncharacterized protein involved in exopolysaccharide biosynthesis
MPVETQPEPDDEISLIDLLQVVAENLRLLVFGSLAGGLLALGIAFLIPPTFTAKTQFLPPKQDQAGGFGAALMQAAVGSVGGSFAGLKNPGDQYVSFLKSRTVLDGLIDRFDLQTRYKKEFKDDTRKALLGNTTSKAAKEGIVELEVDDHDPKFAADLANGYITELRKLMATLAITDAQRRRVFFEGKMRETQALLEEAERKLRETGVSEATLKSSPMSAVEVVAELKGAISAQEIKLGSMRGYLSESAPEFKQAMVEWASLKAQLAKAESDEPFHAGQPKGAYVERYRDYKYQETLLTLFRKQYELARVDEGREGQTLEVVDFAVPPERKSKPKKALMAILATFATGFLLLIYVFLRNNLRKLKEDQESAQKLADVRRAWRRALWLR